MVRVRQIVISVAVLFLAAAVVRSASAQTSVDPKLPSYQKTAAVSGSIKSVGSDTMNNLMTLWGEGFKKSYPNVKIEIEGKGSSTAMPALIEGTATFGPMRREPKPDEIDGFEKKRGYKPAVLPTSIDMLAVYVHKDNPIDSLSLQQIDAIFSKTRKLGASEEITTWGQLGVKGEWENAPISLYGRNSASGTYGYFKEHALGKGDYKDSVKEQPGSAAVVQAVAADKFAIGYSGIGYKTADVRAVPLSATPKSKPVPADPKFATGGYPLARFLLLTFNHKPNSKLDPLRREFLRYVLSKQGQEAVIKDGYIPLSASATAKYRTQFGLDGK